MIVAVKWGAIIGVATYLVGLALGFFSQTLNTTGSASITDRPVLLIPICLGIFVLLFAASAAGFYTGRETGIAGMGAIAGIVLFVVTNLLGLIYTPGGHVSASSSPLWTQVLGLALDLGIAACMGWLGGRPGAMRSPLRAKGTPSATAMESLPERPPAES